jgi:hypothetical protein
MKRRIAIVTLLLLLCFGCAPALQSGAIQTQTPVQTAILTPEPTPEPTPAPTPEPADPAPKELLSAPYNLFTDVAFPAGYTVYGARYDSAQPEKGLNDHYVLYLTVEGDKAQTARYFADLLGVTDETTITGYADALTRDGFAQIDGAYHAVPAVAQLKQTQAGVDAGEIVDVDGCRAELSLDLDASQIPLFQAFIRANTNTSVFGTLADRFPDDALALDRLSCYVNLAKPEITTFYLIYRLQDALALEQEIASQLPTSWHDEASHSLGLTYGNIQYGLRFNLDDNSVRVDLNPNDNAHPAGAFSLSEQSLSKLGFQYFPQDGLAIYEDKGQNIQVAIAHPDWHHAEDWNLLILCDSNKQQLMFQYFEQEARFMVVGFQNDQTVGSNYDLKTNMFDQGFPKPEEMQACFTKALGSAEGDLRVRVLEVFTTLLQERFGLTWQELYALPVW